MPRLPGGSPSSVVRGLLLACVVLAQSASAQDYPLSDTPNRRLRARRRYGHCFARALGRSLPSVSASRWWSTIARGQRHHRGRHDRESAAGRLHAAHELHQHDGDEREHAWRIFRTIRCATLRRDAGAVTPYLATVNAGLPANTCANSSPTPSQPRQLNFGSSGPAGRASRGRIAEGDGRHRADARAVQRLVACVERSARGHIQLTFSQPPIVLAHIKSGKLKGLAISSAHRLAVLPEFLTIAESGVPGYEATSWQGLVAPAGTSRAIVMKLNSEIRRALQLPEIGARLAAEGSEAGNTTPDEFGAYIRREIAKWSRVVKESGIRVD